MSAKMGTQSLNAPLTFEEFSVHVSLRWRSPTPEEPLLQKIETNKQKDRVVYRVTNKKGKNVLRCTHALLFDHFVWQAAPDISRNESKHDI